MINTQFHKNVNSSAVSSIDWMCCGLLVLKALMIRLAKKRCVRTHTARPAHTKPTLLYRILVYSIIPPNYESRLLVYSIIPANYESCSHHN